jgi:beta-glucanase (GH16 family)
VTWNQSGFYFWEDYVDGTEPYFSVPTIGIEDLNDPIRKWPFGDADYTMFPVLNLAVGGSGGGDPASGAYPADMLASAAIRALYTLPATTVLCRRRRAEFPYFRL